MTKATAMGFGLVLSAWTWLDPASVSAQMAPAPSSTGSSSMPSGAMLANPYMNPYFNPYLNPMATQRPMNASNALLYMYSANAANGGIGSGKISGTRGVAAPRTRAAEMPNAVARPGGSAAKFFNPGPGTGIRGGITTGKVVTSRIMVVDDPRDGLSFELPTSRGR